MFGEAKRRLDENTIDLIEQIENINKTLNDTSQAKEARRNFLNVIKNFKNNFYKVELSKQKELLQSLISSVIVSKNKIDINYRI